MAELVNQNHESEYDAHRHNGDKKVRHKISDYSLCQISEVTRGLGGGVAA